MTHDVRGWYALRVHPPPPREASSARSVAPPAAPPLAWLLAAIWISSTVAILVAVIWSLVDNPAVPPGEPYCITYLECPVDQTP